MLLLTLALVLGEVENSSETLITEALELLQANKKEAAIVRLERGFQTSKSLNEKIEIAVLLLEATSEKYAKREAYLRFVAKSKESGPSVSRWLKELGDRAFDRGQLKDAREFYERAQIKSEDPHLIRYKIAFIDWNEKKSLTAFDELTSLYSTVSESLKAQIRKDLARLWWDVGALSPNSLTQVQRTFAKEEFEEIVNRLLEGSPRIQNFGPKENAVIGQLFSISQARTALETFFSNEERFLKNPCYPIRVYFAPGRRPPRNLLLRCLKSNERPSAEELLVYFSDLDLAKDENLLWAKSELLEELSRAEDALLEVFGAARFDQRTKDFLKYIESLLIHLSEEEFKSIHKALQPEAFELYLKSNPSDRILRRLQQLNPERWLSFEENALKHELSLDFLLRKGAFVAKKEPPSLSELEDIVSEIAKRFPEKIAEAQNLLNQIRLKAETQLSSTFNAEFKRDFDQWLQNLEKLESKASSISSEIRKLYFPLISSAISKNVRNLIEQLRKTELDPDLKELAESFEKKKRAMIEELKLRYKIKEPSE